VDKSFPHIQAKTNDSAHILVGATCAPASFIPGGKVIRQQRIPGVGELGGFFPSAHVKSVVSLGRFITLTEIQLTTILETYSTFA
jgi:hypothetical protein